MSDVVELSYNQYEIDKIRLMMMEYLVLNKPRLGEFNNEYFIHNLSVDIQKISHLLIYDIAKAKNFIKEVENKLGELKMLEVECIKKWNETNSTKEGTEGLCQEQSVS